MMPTPQFSEEFERLEDAISAARLDDEQAVAARQIWHKFGLSAALRQVDVMAELAPSIVAIPPPEVALPVLASAPYDLTAFEEALRAAADRVQAQFEDALAAAALREIGLAEATIRSIAHRELANAVVEKAPAPEKPPTSEATIDRIASAAADAAAAAVKREEDARSTEADTNAREAVRLDEELSPRWPDRAKRADVLRRAAQIATPPNPDKKLGF